MLTKLADDQGVRGFGSTRQLGRGDLATSQSLKSNAEHAEKRVSGLLGLRETAITFSEHQVPEAKLAGRVGQSVALRSLGGSLHIPTSWPMARAIDAASNARLKVA